MITPIILSNIKSDQEEECDCACPSPSTPSVVFTDSAQQWRRVFNLYETPIKNDFSLVFDPMGLGKMAVLNSPALKVMDAFSTPQTINDVPAKLPELKSDDVISTAEKMATLGLLQTEPKSLIKPVLPSKDTLTAWLHLTNECNLRCDYCYLYKTHESMTLEKGMQAVDAVFRSAQAQSYREVKLKYAGGESTLEFDLIVQLHDYAQEQSKKLGVSLIGVILTNGIGISHHMIESIHERGLRLSISLDGIGQYHDAQRKFQNGSGSFKLVERSLARLRQYDFKPSITITVSQRNAEGLPQVVEYLLEQGFPFTINFFRENEYSAPFEDLLYQDEKMIDAMRAAFIKIENNFPPFSILGTITDRARLDTPHLQPCGVGHSYMVIDQNGNVAKCHMEIKRTVTDISVADPLKVLQLDTIGIQNHSVEEKEGCRDCDWRYYCAGGCPALTYRVTGRYDVKSPNCRIYKALFQDVLRLEGMRLLKYANAL